MYQKFRLLILFLAISFSPFFVYSQTDESINISANFRNTPHSEVLQNIERQYPVKFYFKNEWFDKDTASIDIEYVPLNQFMDKFLSGKPYIYKEIQKNIIAIIPKNDYAMIMGQMYEQEDMTTIIVGKPSEAGKFKKVEVKGHVKDGKTGEALIGSNIVIENTTQGTVSNVDGNYTLVLTPGNYNLVVSNIGYETTVYKVKVISNGTLDMELFVTSHRIEDVNIYAQRPDKNVRGNQMSMVEIDSKVIKQLPSLTGEKDIIKSFTMMPGVKSVGEFGSGINVRGGGEDQNLYLLENAPIFNTSHVFGFISVLNPDAVSSVTLYKGHIPAGFGERVSSVMDIQIKDNNCKVFKSKGGIGLYNSRLMIEGPMLNDKITFKIGGRTSYSDYLLRQLNDYYLMNSSASFYDANALVTYKNDGSKITLFGYISNDKFNYAKEQAYEYGNKLASFNWSYIFNHDWSSSLTAAYSKYNVNLDYLNSIVEKRKVLSSISYTSGKYNLKYVGIPNHALDGGIQAISYNIDPGEQRPLDTISLVLPATLKKEHSLEGSLYFNDLYEINQIFSINAGLRYTAYAYLGPQDVYTYNSNHTPDTIYAINSTSYGKNKIVKSYMGLEPRISFKVQFDNKNSVKLSYNRNNQYITLLSYTSVPTPNDIWKLSDPFLQPVKCDQFAIGYYRNFKDNAIETSVELYYKKLDNLVEYKNDAKIEMNQHIETELINAEGKNYGIELLLKKNKGKLDGWISYTYSRSLKKTNSRFKEEVINNNNYYPSSYDKPHDLTIVGTYHVNRRWRVGANFSFASGRPVTLPENQYTMGNRQQLIYYSDRNKYRLPPYHRLDISISLDESLKLKKKWKGSWTIGLINVYGRKNIYSVFYKKDTPSQTNNFHMFSLYKLYIIGRPLPTITYNFIF